MSLPIPFPASTISLPYGAVDGKYYTFSSPHQGTDFSSRSRGVTAGTVFRASGPGTVVRSGVGPAGVAPTITRPNSLAGNSIDVDYGDFIARYMHRPYNSPSPKAGDRVAEGAVLGVIGNTGLSSGAHLHMETWDKRTRRRVNPANYFDFTRVVSSATPAADTARPFTPTLEHDMSPFILVHPADGIDHLFLVGAGGNGVVHLDPDHLDVGTADYWKLSDGSTLLGGLPRFNTRGNERALELVKQMYTRTNPART